MKNAWTMGPVNTAGLALFEDDYPLVAEGDYEVLIEESEDWVKKGSAGGSAPSSVIFRNRISEQCSEKGKTLAVWIGKADNEGSRRGWKSAYASIGVPLDKLEGVLTPHPSHFTGKKAFVSIRYDKPLSEGKPKSDEINTQFLSPQGYAKRKADRGGNPVLTPIPAGGVGNGGESTSVATPGFSVGGAPPMFGSSVGAAPPIAAPLPPNGPGGSGLFSALPTPQAVPGGNSGGVPPMPGM